MRNGVNTMKTILVCNQKGGAGKTLIADEIAFALNRAGIKYNFYDLDHQGGSIHKNHEERFAKYAIVDTPGSLQKDLVEWMKSADLIIIPTKMSSRDIQPLQSMIDIVNKPEIKAPVIYVLNGWNRFRASHDFVEWFEMNYQNANKVLLPQSELFVQCGSAGVSVCDNYANNRKTAYKAVKELIKTIEDELQVKFVGKVK